MRRGWLIRSLLLMVLTRSALAAEILNGDVDRKDGIFNVE